MTSLKSLEDAAQLKMTLKGADIVPLLMVLVHFTEAVDLMDRCAPYIRGPFDYMQHIPEELQQEIIDRLALALGEYAAGKRPLPSSPSDALFTRMMTAAVGHPISPKYVEMMRDDFGFGGNATGNVVWSRPPNAEILKSFRVAIVGAGLSGIVAAIRLKQAGIPFIVFEKNRAVGGTWFENDYPGCGCDTPNHFYSYSFELNASWSEYYSKRDELWSYCERCVEKYGIAENLRLNTEVLGATYDEAARTWAVRSRRVDGGERLENFNAVITAVGQLNRPSIPYIQGAEMFRGPAFHTSRWDKTISVEDRRVAIIGTGASAMQVGPAIAGKVDRLLIFQRSPQWMIPNPNYHRSVTDDVQWVLQYVPFYGRWYRFQLFWGFGDYLHGHLQIDPDWPTPDISLSQKNDNFRKFALAHIEKEIGDNPALLEKVVPRYPIFGKRLLMDNRWYKMLKRENVDLVTDPIDHIEADAVVMRDGVRHPIDILLYATGFQAQKMLVPMEIHGIGGERLHDRWREDDPRAYLGITVPGFPNLFLLYGPNTNLAHGGSAVFNSECQVRYTTRALKYLIENGYVTMDVKRDIHDRYNEQVDAANSRMVWSHKGMTNWYKNSKGRVTQNMPWTMGDYWHMTKEIDPNDYHFKEAGPTRAAVNSSTSSRKDDVMAAKEMPEALQALLDKEAIRDCLMRYCHGVDRCDEEMIRGVYWPEATDEHGMFDGLATEYITMLMPMLRKMEATSHTLGHIWIVLEGDRARVETYMSAYHRARSSSGVLRDSVISGRYLDRMEKRGGEWRILKRAVAVDWFRQYPDSADWEKTRVLKAMKPSGRKPDDRYYNFFELA